MKSSKVFLSNSLIIREEVGGVLLFNKNNNAVLKISNSLFELLKRGVARNNDSLRNAIDLLCQKDMIEFSNTSNHNENGKKAVKKSKFSTLYGLNSSLNPFIILWAITSRCNLRCIYCFPDVKSTQGIFTSLPLEKLYQIADQIIKAKVFQLTLSGGEALLDKNIWKVISRLYKHNIQLTIISNGAVIDDQTIKNLIKYEMIVGVSLDAHNEEINSRTRGKNIFQKTVRGIKKLKKANIQTAVLITLNRYNFPVLCELIAFIYDLGVTNITIQDLRPFGTVDDYDRLRLTSDQERKLYKIIKLIKENYPDVNFNLSELMIFPNPDFKTKQCGKMMQCPAGDNFAYIDYYGDMYPCTSLPTMKLGNVLDKADLTELWQSSSAIKALRKLKSQELSDIPVCKSCEFLPHCYGGCRGDALFYSGDIYGYPSRCPKLMQLYEEKNEAIN